MHKITRISFNSADWHHPTGEAQDLEAPGTYSQVNGFGHEDWLFRSEWLIDGWRYAFIQGVNKSHAKLVKDGQSFDLTLYTIQRDKQRRLVALVRNVECLDGQQAQDALEEFKKRGWYGSMQEGIASVGGNTAALGDAQWAKHILNVRFRLSSVQRFEPNTYAQADDPINRLNRYQLYNDSNDVGSDDSKPLSPRNLGSTSLPNPQPFNRRGTQPTECTPEHARMQKKLMAELRKEYPAATVVRERYFIDVSVQTEQEHILFEIKSDLDPKSVIRQALGQLLEYAYHPPQLISRKLRLVIVGRMPLSPENDSYLQHLQTKFSLPISYRVVKI